MLGISAFRKLRQEDCEFEASVDYIVDLVSKNKKENNTVIYANCSLQYMAQNAQ
jgi:hypothetical protein